MSIQSPRQTIGVLAGWQWYDKNVISHYLFTLLRGIRTAASAEGCNLLLACGVGPVTTSTQHIPAWPTNTSDTNFVPVGPWNADGLIVVLPLISASRSRYVQDLRAHGFPIVFLGPGEPGPAVVVDNASGIWQLFTHLVAHGHSHIAFIAGHPHNDSDSDERLAAYYAAAHAHGYQPHPQLIAYGYGEAGQSYHAMQAILESGRPCTAVIASNDQSAKGVMRALSEAGLRVPEDVAVVGFDDDHFAKALTPPLTTVRNPVVQAGKQAVTMLLGSIRGQAVTAQTITIPVHLVIRESCGCQPQLPALTHVAEYQSQREQRSKDLALAGHMADAVLIELQLNRDEAKMWCQGLIDAFRESLRQADAQPFNAAVNRLLTTLDNDDPYPWLAAINVLRNELSNLGSFEWSSTTHAYAEQLLHQAQSVISERIRRHHVSQLVERDRMIDQVGLMTARLLVALDQNQILDILGEGLPTIGIQHAHVALFESEDDDPFAWSTLCARDVTLQNMTSRRFRSRNFPPPGLYPDDRPVSLALLPLLIDDGLSGFVAFDAANLEPCGLIVHHLASAFRGSRLYQVAAEGRRLAEAANRIKTRFLSTVSHELRTPLNVIIGLSELLLREQGGTVSPVPQDIERIYSSAQHLGLLIRDVLDLASSDAGHLRLAREPLDLVETLQTVLAAGQQLAHDKGLDWRVQLPERAIQVWGDRARLGQIVLNLLSNAVKFTHQGTITLRVDVQDDCVSVSVSDTGLGISLEEQTTIFDEFHQSERTAARGYGGLGLGLAISKHLVELHGGVLAVRSSGIEGEGATFSFTLPLLAEQPATAQVEPAAPTVLVLATQVDTGEEVETHLRQQGFKVVWMVVESGADWLACILETVPTAVLLGQRLAAERGWEILRGMKDHPTTRDLPVMLFSLRGDGRAGTMLHVDYRLKPLNSDHLARTIGELASISQHVPTLLIVDDDPDTLDLHTRLARMHVPTCRVLQARNGREALASIADTRPDLILLDLMMPELNGFDVIEALQSQAATRTIPVLVLTSQVLTPDDMARLNRGVAAVLEKGLYTVEETLMHLAGALSRAGKLGSATQRTVRKTMTYIHAHYAEPITREQLARHASLSEDYLTHCFHQELGITPMTYLTRYRIKHACALLEAGDQSVAAVALAVGFADGAYFTRVFQREVGVSPGAYRRGRRSPR